MSPSRIWLLSVRKTRRPGSLETLAEKGTLYYLAENREE